MASTFADPCIVHPRRHRQFRKVLAAGDAGVFGDFHGTLALVADDPRRVVADTVTCRHLRLLTPFCEVGVLSGETADVIYAALSRRDANWPRLIRERIYLDHIEINGVAGAQWRYGGVVTCHPRALPFKLAVRRAEAMLRSECRLANLNPELVYVENKGDLAASARCRPLTAMVRQLWDMGRRSWLSFRVDGSSRTRTDDALPAWFSLDDFARSYPDDDFDGDLDPYGRRTPAGFMTFPEIAEEAQRELTRTVEAMTAITIAAAAKCNLEVSISATSCSATAPGWRHKGIVNNGILARAQARAARHGHQIKGFAYIEDGVFGIPVFRELDRLERDAGMHNLKVVVVTPETPPELLRMADVICGDPAAAVSLPGMGRWALNGMLRDWVHSLEYQYRQTRPDEMWGPPPRPLYSVDHRDGIT